MASSAFLLGTFAHSATRTWDNAGTDFNTAANWTGGLPGTSDIATYGAGAATVQPNVSANISVSGLNFSDATTTGYDLTSSGGASLTLGSISGAAGAASITGVNTSGVNTIDAALILGAANNSTQTFTQAAGGTLVINGPISNTNNINLSLPGAGTVTLAGNNSFSGSTTLSNGTLNLNHNSALGTNGGLTINNGTIDNTSGAARSIASPGNVVVGTTGFSFSTAAGTTANNLTFAGGMSYSGPRTITLNGAGALAFAGALSETNTTGQTLTVNNGAGTASTTGISFGGITLGNVGGTGARALTIQGTGKVTITGAITDGNGFANSLINGSTGGLTLAGSGNTFSGGISNTGVLNLNSATALGLGTLTMNAGSVINNTSGAALTLTTTNAVVLGAVSPAVMTYGTSAGTASNDLTFGNGAVTYNGSRIVVLNGEGSLTFGGTLSATNTSSGNMNLTVNNGTSDSGKFGSITFGSFALGPNVTSTQTVTLAGNGKINVTGPVTNGGAFANNLTYSGSGALTLSGNNTYSGATTISGAGVLRVNNTSGSGVGTGPLTIGASAILTGSGRIVTGGSAGTTVSGAINPGDIGAVGTLVLSGGSTTGATLTMNSLATFTFDLGATADKVSFWGYAGSSDFVRNSNVITINALPGAATGTYTLFDFYSNDGVTATASGITSGLTLATLPTGWVGNLVYNTNSIDLNLTAVPEPSTWMLLCFAGIFCLLRVRRLTRNGSAR